MGGVLDPVVSRARNLIADNMADLGPGSSVVAAVSGGADSLALAAALAFVARKEGWLAKAIVIDHQLQEDSVRISAEAAATVRTLGIEADIVVIDVGSGGGPEAAARVARYGALDAIEDVDAVLLGHTLDDQAETVLLGLSRGSGPRSIAGMAPVSGRYRRPFLGMARSETEQVCRASGLTWWTDPHNSDPAYLRVRVRHEVIPMLEDVLGPRINASLARTADLVRADSDYLDALAALQAGPLAVGHLAGLAGPIRSRVLRRASLEAGASASELSAHHLRQVDELITNWRGQKFVELPGGIAVARRGDTLSFGPNPVTP